MTVVHMSEAELASDISGALAKVRQGFEIVIKHDHRPVAVLRAQQPSGRPITEIIREARQRNSTVTLDEDFGNDLEEIAASHRKPRNPPSWD